MGHEFPASGVFGGGGSEKTEDEEEACCWEVEKTASDCRAIDIVDGPAMVIFWGGIVAGLGSWGNDACGEGGGRTNSVRKRDLGRCEQDARRSSTLVILAMVSLDGGGGEGGGMAISSVSRVDEFGDRMTTFFAAFLADTAIDDRRRDLLAAIFAGDFDFRRVGEASFLAKTLFNPPGARPIGFDGGGSSTSTFCTSHAARSSKNCNRCA